MNDDLSVWLSNEVSELLDAGSVGLYEFIWLLRSKYPEMPEEEMTSNATLALERILECGDVYLASLRWPNEIPIAILTRAELRGDCWRPPQEHGAYVAVLRD